jgi:hypothetical protein
VFDISDSDVKPDVKTEDGGAGSSTRGVAVAGATAAVRAYFLEIYVKPAHVCAKFNEIGGFL